MPRFSQRERESIAAALLQQGERLFCEYGLGKVSVEEIVRSVGIAKGSFYAFYGSKQELYFDILARCQQDMWARMAMFLSENSARAPRDLFKSGIGFVFHIIDDYPMIKRTDAETTMLLLRRLPDEVKERHFDEDAQAAALFLRHGIRFKRPVPVVAKVLQSLYGAWVMSADSTDELAGQVLDIMIGGIAYELVEEER